MLKAPSECPDHLSTLEQEASPLQHCQVVFRQLTGKTLRPDVTILHSSAILARWQLWKISLPNASSHSVSMMSRLGRRGKRNPRLLLCCPSLKAEALELAVSSSLSAKPLGSRFLPRRQTAVRASPCHSLSRLSRRRTVEPFQLGVAGQF